MEFVRSASSLKPECKLGWLLFQFPTIVCCPATCLRLEKHGHLYQVASKLSFLISVVVLTSRKKNEAQLNKIATTSSESWVGRSMNLSPTRRSTSHLCRTLFTMHDGLTDYFHLPTLLQVPVRIWIWFRAFWTPIGFTGRTRRRPTSWGRSKAASSKALPSSASTDSKTCCLSN